MKSLPYKYDGDLSVWWWWLVGASSSLLWSTLYRRGPSTTPPRTTLEQHLQRYALMQGIFRMPSRYLSARHPGSEFIIIVEVNSFNTKNIHIISFWYTKCTHLLIIIIYFHSHDSLKNVCGWYSWQCTQMIWLLSNNHIYFVRWHTIRYSQYQLRGTPRLNFGTITVYYLHEWHMSMFRSYCTPLCMLTIQVS